LLNYPSNFEINIKENFNEIISKKLLNLAEYNETLGNDFERNFLIIKIFNKIINLLNDNYNNINENKIINMINLLQLSSIDEDENSSSSFPYFQSSSSFSSLSLSSSFVTYPSGKI
jgi:hypothetical protein